MDTPGFISPPPGLIPPRHDTDTHTAKAPGRPRELPVFKPPTAPSSAAAAEQRAERPGVVLVLPTGARVPIDGATLFGRNPVRFGSWGGAELVAVDDPARSVSKTHAAIEPAGDGVRVTDLHSTNGVTIVTSDGAENAVTTEAGVVVAAGDTVRLGDYPLVVALAG